MKASVLAVVVVALVSCKKPEPKVEDVVAGEQKNLEPIAAGIERVARTKLPAPTGKLSIEGPPPKIFSMDDGNAIFAFDRDLVDFTAYPKVPLRSAATSQLANDCVMLARKKSMAGLDDMTTDRDPMLSQSDLAWIQTTITKCKKLRYLIVLNLTGFKDTQYIDKESFVGGKAKGDALVFDLVTGKYAGGVPFKAESSKFTKSTPDSDLWNNFYNAVDDALSPVAPPGSRLK